MDTTRFDTVKNTERLYQRRQKGWHIQHRSTVWIDSESSDVLKDVNQYDSCTWMGAMIGEAITGTVRKPQQARVPEFEMSGNRLIYC